MPEPLHLAALVAIAYATHCAIDTRHNRRRAEQALAQIKEIHRDRD